MFDYGGLPVSLMVGDEECRIDPSLENCLAIMDMYDDKTLPQMIKQRVLVEMMFLDEVPFCTESLEAALWFLDGGEDAPVQGRAGAKRPRLYSFGQDMRYIRSAIQRTHGVNLRERWDLHWWKFIDMFMDLDEDCMFSTIIRLRQKKLDRKLDKDEKKLWAKMRDVFELRAPGAEAINEELSEIEKKLERLEGLSMKKGGAGDGGRAENHDKD